VFHPLISFAIKDFVLLWRHNEFLLLDGWSDYFAQKFRSVIPYFKVFALFHPLYLNIDVDGLLLVFYSPSKWSVSFILATES